MAIVHEITVVGCWTPRLQCAFPGKDLKVQPCGGGNAAWWLGDHVSAFWR